MVITRGLYNFKPPPPPYPWKMKKSSYILYNLHNLFLLNMSISNDLVIKNDLFKKKNPSLFLWRGFNCITTKPWYYKTKLFTAKFSVDSKFNILANLNLVLPTSRKFSVSRSLVKDVQNFGQFSHRYFKLCKK